MKEETESSHLILGYLLVYGVCHFSNINTNAGMEVDEALQGKTKGVVAHPP